MESLNPKFALHGSKDKCTRTDTVFLPLSEVREWVVSLRQLKLCEKKQRGDGSTVSPAIQWMWAPSCTARRTTSDNSASWAAGSRVDRQQNRMIKQYNNHKATLGRDLRDDVKRGRGLEQKIIKVVSYEQIIYLWYGNSPVPGQPTCNKVINNRPGVAGAVL